MNPTIKWELKCWPIHYWIQWDKISIDRLVISLKRWKMVPIILYWKPTETCDWRLVVAVALEHHTQTGNTGVKQGSLAAKAPPNHRHQPACRLLCYYLNVAIKYCPQTTCAGRLVVLCSLVAHDFLLPQTSIEPMEYGRIFWFFAVLFIPFISIG